MLVRGESCECYETQISTIRWAVYRRACVSEARCLRNHLLVSKTRSSCSGTVSTSLVRDFVRNGFQSERFRKGLRSWCAEALQGQNGSEQLRGQIDPENLQIASIAMFLQQINSPPGSPNSSLSLEAKAATGISKQDN